MVMIAYQGMYNRFWITSQIETAAGCGQASLQPVVQFR